MERIKVNWHLLSFTICALGMILSCTLHANKRLKNIEIFEPKATKTKILQQSSKGRAVRQNISEIPLVDAVFDHHVDGDTSWYIVKGKKVDVRYFGIDSPESNCFHKKQKGGIEAKEYLSTLLKKGDKVKLKIIGSGNHDRIAAIIFKNDVNINEEMVRAGWAWVFSDYAKKDKEWNEKLIAIQENARKNRLGLFGIEKKPTEPWVWRANLRAEIKKRKAA